MRRHGWLVGETLIAFLVLATALGIAVPLVERARDAEKDRVDTANRMKTCVLAVHNFHDTYRRLPDAFAPGGMYVKDAKSVWFHLLPYVGADQVYRKALMDAEVPAYLAPQDRFDQGTAGRLSFAANLRLVAYGDLTAAQCNKPGVALTLPADGTVLRSNLTFPRIVDGTSNTFLMATRRASCDGKSTLFGAHPADFGGFFGAGTHDKASGTEQDDRLMFQVAPPGLAKGRDVCTPTSGIFGHAFTEQGLLTGLADGTVKMVRAMSTTTFTRALCPGDQNPLGADWTQ